MGEPGPGQAARGARRPVRADLRRHRLLLRAWTATARRRWAGRCAISATGSRAASGWPAGATGAFRSWTASSWSRTPPASGRRRRRQLPDPVHHGRRSRAAAAEAAIAAMRRLPNIVMPFPGGVVRSGSKIGSRYKGLIASTNDAYCPTIRGQTAHTALPPEVGAVLEIVIDGLTEADVATATAVGVRAACALGRGGGVVAISAGNYGGQLGPYHFHLQRGAAMTRRPPAVQPPTPAAGRRAALAPAGWPARPQAELAALRAAGRQPAGAAGRAGRGHRRRPRHAGDRGRLRRRSTGSATAWRAAGSRSTAMSAPISARA